jgi:hypothetical protein
MQLEHLLDLATKLVLLGAGAHAIASYGLVILQIRPDGTRLQIVD